MVEIIRTFDQLRRKIAVVLLAGLLAFISLPATSDQAAGYYSGDYSSNSAIEQKIGQKPNHIPKIDGDNYIESAKRAGEELGNDQPQRVYGSKDYDRDHRAIEEELAGNKARHGYYNQADNGKRRTDD